MSSADDVLRKDDWEVRNIDIATASRLVELYHYARGCSNTAAYLHGLFRVGEWWDSGCCGVAWWLPPSPDAAKSVYPCDWRKVLGLSRLVIVPDMPRNACSFLIARSKRMIDSGRWECLLTYADEWQGQ